MSLLNLHDYEKRAEKILPKSYFDFFQGGSNDEVTLRANQEAFNYLQLRPRVLINVSNIDMSTTILGTPVKIPIMIAPSAVHKLAHRSGEIATAKAAKSHNTVMVVSTLSSFSIEEIAKTGCKLWLQLYIYKDQKTTRDFIARAEKSGYSAIVLTVDTPMLGRRERDLRNNFKLPKKIKLANFISKEYKGKLGDERETITWDTIKWIRSITKLPIVLKGILTREDALLAVKNKVDGIIVSNHGGRQLDHAVTTIEALPEVIKAVNGHCEVYMDSGVRRGTDVLKALALGARAVLIGRPILWGLSVDGEKGANDILKLLSEELKLSMILTGSKSLKNISKNIVRITGFNSGFFK